MFKLIVAKCVTAKIAEDVSRIVSAASSVDPAKLRQALVANSIGIKMHGATQAQIESMRDRIQQLGVGVSVQEIVEDVLEAVATPPPKAPEPPKPAAVERPRPEPVKPRPAPAAKAPAASNEDEDEDSPSDFQNLVLAVDRRSDLFHIETERPLLATLLVSLIVGISTGFWFNGMDFISYSPDFFEKLPAERTAKLVVDLPKIEKQENKDKKKKSQEKELDKKKPKPKPKGSGLAQGSAGDPRTRVTHKGVLGIISGKVKGKSVVGSDVLSGSFAKDIDAVLENIGGLKRSGDAGSGRKGLAGVGFGKGYGAGFGTGSGGIDDMIGGMFGASEGVGLRKKGGEIKIPSPRSISGVGPGLGGRSQESIMRVVMQHMAGLRYAYNKRLKDKPNLRGTITVRFTIDPPGNVVEAVVIATTMGDPMLENDVITQIQSWQFDAVEKQANAVVQYPFAFSH